MQSPLQSFFSKPMQDFLLNSVSPVAPGFRVQVNSLSIGAVYVLDPEQSGLTIVFLFWNYVTFYPVGLSSLSDIPGHQSK